MPWLREASQALLEKVWAETRALAGDDGLSGPARAQALVADAFSWHAIRYAAPFAERGGAADLYESFLWKIQVDGLLARVRPRVDRLLSARIAADPGLREFYGDSGRDTGETLAEGVVIVPVPQGVAARVAPALEHRLAQVVSQRFMGRAGLPMRAGPYRLAEFPAAQWDRQAANQCANVLATATVLLGRPATALDVLALVRARRAGDLDSGHAKIGCPHPTRGVCVLVPFFDAALRRMGYLHENPFAQRVLVGPLGDRVHVVELAARAARGEPYGLLLGGPMTDKDPDADARRLAAESLAADDPTGWFERLYAESATGDAIVPWDSRSPHALLVEWAAGRVPAGGRALVVGAGTGDDAEYVAGLGYETVAFDVSESAVRLARERFPGSAVDYRVADLLEPPERWRHAFDLVVEIMTVQSMPEELHGRAIARVAEFVRPGGTLLVIATAREEGGPVFAPPWPLTPSEIAAFGAGGMVADRVEDLHDGERRRWRATFHREP